MYDYPLQWSQILQVDQNHQVDILATIHENGFNDFLRKHFEIDQQLPAEERKYYQVFERTFQTFGDPRNFKITLSLTEPINIKLPPFTGLNNSFTDSKKSNCWQAIDYPIDGPELTAVNPNGENLVEVVAPGVTITLEWPRLNNHDLPPWTFTIPPFEVLGQAALELYQEGQDFFVKVIPKLIKIDIPRNNLISLINGNEQKKLLIQEECEEKFIDLFIIAANIAAYEQTPKMVTSIKLPIPVVQERPIQPAIFDISNNMLTVGFGIDKISLNKFNNNILNSKTSEIETLLNKDIEESKGVLNIAFKNSEGKTLKSANQLIARTREEQENFFSNINSFILKEEQFVKSFSTKNNENFEILAEDPTFAVGINEYFFDTIVNSVLPQPQNRCENEIKAGPVKGYICHWTSFTNPDVTISSNATISGEVSIDVGGSINACVKKFWDCSWRWACAKLALAIVGRPKISIKVLPADGIRIFAEISGSLKLASNLPFPFNKIVEALSSVVFKFIMALINVLTALLSFYVIKPIIEIEELHLKITLKNFSSFYFERPAGSNHINTKNKFICFKTNLKIDRL